MNILTRYYYSNGLHNIKVVWIDGFCTQQICVEQQTKNIDSKHTDYLVYFDMSSVPDSIILVRACEELDNIVIGKESFGSVPTVFNIPLEFDNKGTSTYTLVNQSNNVGFLILATIQVKAEDEKNK